MKLRDLAAQVALGFVGAVIVVGFVLDLVRKS